MNRAMQTRWPWIEGIHSLRLLLLDSLSDADLVFSPGGANVALGTLLRESGDVEYSYTQSLKTLKQDWSYHNTEAGLENDVSRLKAWYLTLDQEVKATLEAFSDEELAKTVDRGGGSTMSIEMQLEVYLQAQFIFLGKEGVYFKAMNKSLPQAFQDYIG